MPVAVRYAAPRDLPELIQRGRAVTLSCPVYRGGALAEPSAGTVSLFDGDGEAVVDAEDVDIADEIATFELAADVTEDLALADDWRVAWTLTMPDGVEHTFENRAMLCRVVPSPVVTEATLFANVPALAPDGPAPLATQMDYSAILDEAWIGLSQALLGKGNRPELVVDPSALREPHLLLTLSLVFASLATEINATGSYLEQSRDYERKFTAALASLSFRYDPDDDGDADEVRSARGTVWLM